MKSTRRILIGFLCLAGSIGVASNSSASLFPVHTFGPSEVMKFETFCAKRQPYSLSEYALVESQDGKARATLEVQFTHRVGRKKDVAMYIAPQVIRLRMGSAYGSNQDVQFKFVIQTSEGKQFSSTEVGRYVEHGLHSKNRTSSMLPFRTDEQGNLDWISFTERTYTKQDRNRMYRFLNEDLHLVADKGMGTVKFSLHAKIGANGPPIVLLGPNVRVPDQLWEKIPKSQIMGFFQTINPFNEGSAPRFVSRAFKYRKCIFERHNAKKILDR